MLAESPRDGHHIGHRPWLTRRPGVHARCIASSSGVAATPALATTFAAAARSISISIWALVTITASSAAVSSRGARVTAVESSLWLSPNGSEILEELWNDRDILDLSDRPPDAKLILRQQIATGPPAIKFWLANGN